MKKLLKAPVGVQLSALFLACLFVGFVWLAPEIALGFILIGLVWLAITEVVGYLVDNR